MDRFTAIICGALLCDFVCGSFGGPKVFVDSKSEKEKDAVRTSDPKRRNALRSASAMKPKPPMLELMSLSLDTWGLKSIGNSSVKMERPEEVMAVTGDGHVHPFDQFMSADIGHDNPLARQPQRMNMFDSRAFQPQVEPLNFNLYSQQSKSNFTRTLAVVVLAFIVFAGLAFMLSYVCADYIEDDGKAASPTKEASKLKEGTLSQSSWARAYLEAEGEQKEALELLFRCNIISTEELACSVISQEHIQECTWIATHMLHHRPLEEWVALWQQAQQTFEDSVAECFAQREGQVGFTARALAQRLKISRSQYGSPESPQSHPSLPSSANLDFVSADPSCDLRPLHS